MLTWALKVDLDKGELKDPQDPGSPEQPEAISQLDLVDPNRL